MSAPGVVDARALADWAGGRGLLAPGAEVRVEALAGGSSNPTYRVRGGGVDLVLRTPPRRGGLPTAHDMDREYRFQAALAGGAVPVAPMVALCADPAVIGVPFYLMGRLDGVVYGRAESVRGLPADTAAAVGDELARTLARLHAVDPVAAGLGDYARPEPYPVRQLRRWRRQWAASAAGPVPAVEEVLTALAARVPDVGPDRIVHGDYNLANVMYERDRPERVLAVLDWELAALGPAAADVGQLLAYWGPAGRLLAAGRGGHAPDANPGLPTTEGLLAAYLAECAVAGRGAGGSTAAERGAAGADHVARDELNIRHIPFWEAFAVIKLAIVCAGALGRAADPSGERRERIASLVTGLTAIARDTLEE
ncbi:phosphotransferase family protein [Embleya hyalina]|uniref:Acyl-CoA dehydrogenase n=1 Tax=Embleya hyalina TaxID=516124 RepID=A0A401YKS3_9ACTN|nr:phosphotransferase family protein [Embleya hyalina]GCD95213.1 acyl-CoA dehydrogenase [Embleya hyalina]